MPLTKRSLTLPVSPPSVKLARSWVSTVLTDIGRDDLVETAELGVSELVTNALIHSEPPLLVRVLGTVDHPRIEVVDSSPVAPERAPVSPEPGDVDVDNLATYGRGLDLVAMMSHRWGSDLGHDGRTKTVWFEPAEAVRDDEEAPGEINHLLSEPEGLEVDESDYVTVRLCRLPAALFGELRRYHFELRRELRLLAMAAPGQYPLAEEVTDTFRHADRARRVTRGIDQLDKAIAAGVRTLDMEVQVPGPAPALMARVRDLLERVYEVFSEENLLAVAPVPTLLELQRWYFTEFEHQATGAEPTPWTGPDRLPTA